MEFTTKAKSERSKLLVAVMAMAILFAGAAVVLSDNDVSAENKPVGIVEKSNGLDVVENGDTYVFSGVVKNGAKEGEGSKLFNAGNNLTGEWGYIVLNLGKIIGEQPVTIKQTNSALNAYTDPQDNIKDGVKTQGGYTASKMNDDSVNNGGYALLVPKDGSTVTVEIIDGEKTTTYKLDFSKVSTEITLKDGVTGTGWTFTSSNSTLAFNNYDGREIFTTTGGLNVTFDGKNTISAYGSGESSVIKSAGAMKITAVDSEATLDIVQNTASAFGITCNQDITIGDSGNVKTNISVDGGNRALYLANGGNYTLTIQNSVVDVSASEKAIRIGGGQNNNTTLDVKSSTVTATVSDTGSTNASGADDIFGIKTGKISVDKSSTVTTDGLNVEASGNGVISNNGKIIINGYTQNPNAEMAPVIAGFYYMNFTSTAQEVYTSAPAESGKAYILLQNGAEAFGNVKIISGTSFTEPTVVKDQNAFDKAMSGDADSVIITSGSVKLPTKVTKDVTVLTGATLDLNNTTLTANGGDIIVNGGTVTGTVSNDNNKATFTGVKGTFTVSYGSISIDGKITSGDISILNDVKMTGSSAGNVRITTTSDKMQKVTLGGDFDVTSGTLTIGENVVLVVPENRTLTVTGTLSISGAIAVYGEIVGNVTAGTPAGEYAIADGAKATTGQFTGLTAAPIYKFEDATGINNTITGDTTWNTATYLTGDITIAEGVTVTIARNGFLDLCGHDLIVKGTLVIEGRGYITDKNENGHVYIADTGSVQNDGTIGKDKAVTVSMYTDSKYSGEGSVKMTNVEGVVFGSQKTVSGQNITYTLTVSGDIAENGKNASIVFDDAIIVGEASVDKDVAASGDMTVKGSLDLDCKYSTGTISMLKGATVNINGDVDATVSAQTGEYLTYNDDGSISTAVPGTSTVKLDNLKGVQITVTSKSYDKADEKNYTEQMMSISGTPSFVEKAQSGDTKGSVTLTGNVYVLTGNELVLAEYMTLSGGVIVTEGSVQTVQTEIDSYKGAHYMVKSEGTPAKEIHTYTNFTDAFAQIASAEDNEITLKGGYTFTGEITVADGQSIVFGDNGRYVIGYDGKITVQDGGVVSDDFSEIEGVLVVMDGGDCVPPESAYEVRSENENDDVTYSSAKKAIETATAGTTVYIVKDCTLKEATVIPAGVTVDIADGVTLTAKKGLTVSDTAKIVNKGTVDIDGKYVFNVIGDVDSKDGTVTLEAESEMTVTGSVTGPQVNGKVNAAWYVDDGYTVYTTVAKAVAAVTAMDVKVQITAIGQFSESTDVTLANGMKLIVSGTVSLGTVTLAAGSSMDVSGTLTATVAGATGADASPVTANVVLDKASNLRFAESYNQSKATSALTVSALDASKNVVGGVNVAAGSVTLSGAVTFDGDKGTLKVSSGATLSVPENASITAESNNDKKAAVTVEGTLDVVKGTVTVNAGAVVDVPGELKVAETAAGTTGVIVDVTPASTTGTTTTPAVYGVLNITGTLTVSSEENKTGSVQVNGLMTVADGASVSGPVTIANTDGYIKAYAGADLADARINWNTVDNKSGAKTTVFNINGNAYMTAYAISVDYSVVLKNEKFDMPGYVLQTTDQNVDVTDIEQWFTDADLTQNASDADVGTAANLYFKANSAIVEFNTSYGQGISLYIDGIRVTGNTMKLAVGEHTVSAQVNPGYSGTVTITFNGQTVTDGKFAVTAEMASAAYDGQKVIAVTGDITQNATVIEGGSSDSGMGLTDYLLIVLVVLIVVMAIIVAMRLMRS